MMKCNLVTALLIMSQLLGIDGQQPVMVPCSEDKDTTGPPLPSLPNQFQTHIEANIVQKSMTYNMKEYYDYTNNRGMIEMYNHTSGHRMRTVMNYQEQKAWLIDEKDKTCRFLPTNSSLSTFSFMSGGNSSHIKGVKDLLYFGADMGEKYVNGDKQVRGIAVDHWTTCVKMPKMDAQFTLDYYFSKSPVYRIDGSTSSVPIRAVINGTGKGRERNGTTSGNMHSFYHIYEFFDFHPYVEDTDVFQIPVGIFCDSPVSEKAMPAMPDHFTSGLEIIDGNLISMVVNQMIYYDHRTQILRVDSSGPTTKQELQKFGRSKLTLIQDFNTSLIYTIDQWEQNCTVSSSPRADDDPLLPPFVSLIISGFTGNYIYQGKKTWRGLDTESWSLYNTSANALTEVFFRQESPVSRNRPLGPQPGARQKRVPIPERVIPVYSLVGIYHSDPKSIQKQPLTMHFYGFMVAHPSPDVFDVSSCYQLDHHYSYMAFKVEGNYEKDVLFFKNEFVAAIRSAIARGANVSATRIDSILVEQDPYTDKQMRIFFKLNYEKDVLFFKNEFVAAIRSAIARGATVSATRVDSILVEQDPYTDKQMRVFFKLLDNKLTGIDVKMAGPSLKDAKLNLQDAVSKGINFDVQYRIIEENFMIVKDTLWETMSSETQGPAAPSVQKYSSGAMAGLGVGMLLIGAITGLLAAFIIYKKVDTSIPYKVTN